MPTILTEITARNGNPRQPEATAVMVMDSAETIVVTEENFGALLVAAMEEARRIARGECPPARVTRRAVRD